MTRLIFTFQKKVGKGIHLSFHMDPLLQPWAINSMAAEVKQIVKSPERTNLQVKDKRRYQPYQKSSLPTLDQVQALCTKGEITSLMTLCLQMDLETIIDSFTHLRKGVHLTFPWDYNICFLLKQIWACVLQDTES